LFEERADLWFASDPGQIRTAYYQAGHATVAWLEGLYIEGMSIVAEGDVSGWIDIREPRLPKWNDHWTREDRQNGYSIVKSLLAGYAAQSRYSFGGILPDLDLTHQDVIDDRAIWRAISLMGQIPNGPASSLCFLWRDLRQTLLAPGPWNAIEAIATALLQNEELAGSEIGPIATLAVGPSK
jgi:hypothetical protein